MSGRFWDLQVLDTFNTKLTHVVANEMLGYAREAVFSEFQNHPFHLGASLKC